MTKSVPKHRETKPDAGRTRREPVKGIVLTGVLAAIAAALGTRFPVVGGPVIGIVLGMLVKSTGRVGNRHAPGIAFCAKQLLQYSIILLGAGLSLAEIWETGTASLVVMLGTLVVCLAVAWMAGRAFRISPNVTTLIGVGTAICGASAIAAVSPVIEAEEQDVAYGVSVIFLFNVVAVLVFPPVGRWLGLTQDAFGLWAGTAVNDTSSVVAAAYAYGPEAGAVATIVKLTRSALIIPVALVLSGVKMWRSRKSSGGRSDVALPRLIPWFIVGFVLASAFNTFGLVSPAVAALATATAKFLIVVALTAVGLSADFGQMAKTGLKPAGLGFLLWIVIAVSSLLLQHWSGAFG